MAQTIIIKNGTEGAPTSLSQGELAINTTNGNVFYGDGSKVQTLYTYSYISYTCTGTIPSGPNYLQPSGYGISHHTWNKNTGTTLDGNKDIGVSTIGLEGQNIVGFTFPHDCIIVGFYGITRGNTNTSGTANAKQHGHALWISEEGDIDWGGSNNWGATLRFWAGNTAEGGNEKKFMKIDGMTGATEFAVQAGDMLMPTMWNVNAEPTTQNITIVLKTKLGI